MDSHQENRTHNDGSTKDSELANRIAAETTHRTEASATVTEKPEQQLNTTASPPDAIQEQKPPPNNAKRTTKFFQAKVRQVIRYGHGDFDFTRRSSANSTDNVDDMTMNPWGPASARDVIAGILRPSTSRLTENCTMQGGVSGESPVSLATCAE